MASKMVDAFVGGFASRPEDIVAIVGPAVGPCCYQVDAPVHAALAAHAGADRFLKPCREEGRWMLDLALANRLQIGERGVPDANIHTADLCTACRQELFFSHRASGGRSGRQVNFLMLRPGDRRKSA